MNNVNLLLLLPPVFISSAMGPWQRAVWQTGPQKVVAEATSYSII